MALLSSLYGAVFGQNGAPPPPPNLVRTSRVVVAINLMGLTFPHFSFKPSFFCFSTSIQASLPGVLSVGWETENHHGDGSKAGLTEKV